MRLLTVLLCLAAALSATDLSGTVKFNGVGVPGVLVTATQNGKPVATITDAQGAYTLTGLADGTCALTVQMTGFAPIKQEVTVTAGLAPVALELALLPYSGPPPVATPPPGPATTASAKSAPPAKVAGSSFQRANLASTGAAPPPEASGPANIGAGDEGHTAADALAVNGSMNNGAASPFAQSMAFGNNRNSRSPFNGAFGFIADSSALDAAPYSITGLQSAKPGYSNLTLVGQFGGPLEIPHLWNQRTAPQFFIGYQFMRGNRDTALPGLVPTDAERAGSFSGFAGTIINPATGKAFNGNQVGPISPQAAALLNLFPEPNLSGSSAYNYQIAAVTETHQDSMQVRINKSPTRRDSIGEQFGLQSTRSSGPDLFGFLDSTDTLGLTNTINWRHTFSQRLFGTFSYQYSRQRVQLNPFFANRENVSGNAGITGNNQAPVNWGPPTLNFVTVSSLSDGQPERNRNQTNAFSFSGYWLRGRHNLNFGGDFKRLEFNYFQQQDARGTFTFDGQATGNDFADFLLGIPDTSEIAFGNADKYFRQSDLDGFFNDDFRFSSGITLSLGLRWEYQAPLTERYNRLVNLDIVDDFSAAAPVLASAPTGSVSGQSHPNSLLRPDRHDFEPRLGLAWRPLAASSLVIKASYGIYFNTSVYQSLTYLLAQQAPLSKSLSVPNTAANPLTLASGFNVTPGIEADQYAIDPNFRIGYTQNWTVSAQRDLPWALIGSLTYTGIKGTRSMQEFLPNTYAPGGVTPCPTCPVGFAYFASNGNSTFESGQVRLQRRLSAGLAANVQYNYSDAMDDAALGGRGQGSSVISQNWLDLAGERGPSSFLQRNQLSLQMQYTTGMSARVGALLSGWRAAAYKGWTLSTTLTANSGMPLTPVLPSVAVPGTGQSQVLRPNLTGASVYAAPPGLFLNPGAYVAPAAGQWGDAGRDSIVGPSSWNLNGSLQRSFAVTDRITANLRLDGTNILNHVVFPSWITLIGSPQFGLPGQANAMRSLQTSVRFTF